MTTPAADRTRTGRHIFDQTCQRCLRLPYRGSTPATSPVTTHLARVRPAAPMSS